jgi:hypothetical protein
LEYGIKLYIKLQIQIGQGIRGFISASGTSIALQISEKGNAKNFPAAVT